MPRSDEEWATVEMRVAKSAMAHGSVAAVKSLLRDRKALARIEAHSGKEGETLLAKARTWLKDAVAHEDIHGVDSMLDLNNPWVRDVLVPAKERLRERRRQRLGLKTTAGSGVVCIAELTG